MKVIVLASGSRGNATYVEDGDTRILIDAGISYKQIKVRLEEHQIKLDKLDAILVTHEHTDHTNGLGVLLGNVQSRVYIGEKSHLGCSMSIFDMLRNKNVCYINEYEEIVVGSLKIQPIPLYHDANQCFGFVISNEDKKMVYVTDTGYFHHKDLSHIINADMYVIESNHDPEILMNSTRPLELKKRILGNNGHLSNEDAAALLCYSVGPKTKNIILAHISEECNDVSVLVKTVKEVFQTFNINYDDYQICCAMQHKVSKIFEV